MRWQAPARATLAGMLALAAGCSGAASCPRDRICGLASWVPAAGGPVVEGHFEHAPAVQAVTAGVDLASAEALPVRVAPVFLRFDLAAFAGQGAVEQAILSLVPHPSWRPTGAPVRLVVRAVHGAWNAASVSVTGGPPLGEVPAAEAVLSNHARLPVRLDVTEAVRAWQRGTAPADGVALSAEGADVVFVGPGALAAADRPRLEVVFR